MYSIKHKQPINGVNKMTRKDYIKFATLLKTLNVKFDNKDIGAVVSFSI